MRTVKDVVIKIVGCAKERVKAPKLHGRDKPGFQVSETLFMSSKDEAR